MSDVATIPRPSRARGRARREAIVEAAHNVFAEKGFWAGSLTEIARRVGITEPGVLYHFPTKNDLLLEILKRRSDSSGPRNALITEEPLAGWLKLCRDDATSPELVTLFTVLRAEAISADHPAHKWFVERNRAARERYTEALRKQQAAGEVASDLDPETLAIEIMAMFNGLHTQWLLDRESVDVVAVMESYLRRLRAAA